MATVEVIGVKQMLQDLRQIDPEARKQFAKGAKPLPGTSVVGYAVSLDAKRASAVALGSA
jgi:hypothetical protein